MTYFSSKDSFRNLGGLRIDLSNLTVMQEIEKGNAQVNNVKGMIINADCFMHCISCVAMRSPPLCC